MRCTLEYAAFSASFAYGVLHFSENWTVWTVRFLGNREFGECALERKTRIEPATNGLGSRDSTIELLPLYRCDYKLAFLAWNASVSGFYEHPRGCSARFVPIPRSPKLKGKTTIAGGFFNSGCFDERPEERNQNLFH